MTLENKTRPCAFSRRIQVRRVARISTLDEAGVVSINCALGFTSAGPSIVAAAGAAPSGARGVAGVSTAAAEAAVPEPAVRGFKISLEQL